MSTTDDLLARLSKKKGAKKGKKSRKHERQYRYYGQTHSQTLYRSRGQREKNKARRAAQRERRLTLLRERHGIYQADDRPEDQAD